MLGAVAAVAAIAWVARELGIEAAELERYAITSALLVLGMMALAVAGAVLVRWLRRLRR